MTAKTAAFIAKYENAIIEACAGTNIFPSVKMAQACLESGWGDSVFYNNMFGIKATGKLTPYWSGLKKSGNTHETKNGKDGVYNLAFRQYATVSDSIRDHTYLLQNVKTYTSHGVFTAATPEAQARALKAAGYATDPNYAETLISIINSHGLKRLDEKKKP